MEGYRFNKHGELVPIKVFVVWGSPGSGKTTYVKNNMRLGDMVVDLDLIKQSISFQDRDNVPDSLVNIAIKIRDYIYTIIADRKITDGHIWVVAGLPTKKERIELNNKIKADEFIFIESTEEECISRVMKDKERTDKEKQVYIIKKWFEKYYYE